MILELKNITNLLFSLRPMKFSFLDSGRSLEENIKKNRISNGPL
jgi:hypothetical protein